MRARYILGKILNMFLFWRYPYTAELKVFGKTCLFRIHNRVEEFRILKFGGEKAYVYRLLKSLREGDIFYDVGSSVGLFSILSSKILKKGKIVSFEPDPDVFSCLRENIQINKLNNIITLPYVISDKKKAVKLYSKGSGNSSPSIKPVQGFKQFIMVEGNTLDNVIEEERLSKPDVIKIDVEGSEMKVLSGAKRLFSSRQRPRDVFIEIHPRYLKEFGSSENEVLKYFEIMKYKVIWMDDRDNEKLYHLKR
jgi:FkbM family methyltransferase